MSLGPCGPDIVALQLSVLLLRLHLITGLNCLVRRPAVSISELAGDASPLLEAVRLGRDLAKTGSSRSSFSS